MDFLLIAVFELLALVLSAAAVRDWRTTKRKRELLPVAAYVVALLARRLPLRRPHRAHPLATLPQVAG